MFHKLFFKLIFGCVEFLTLHFGGGGSAPASGGNDNLWNAQASQVNQSSAMSGELFDNWQKYAPTYLNNTSSMMNDTMDGTLTSRLRNQAATDANTSLGMGLDAATRDMSRYGADFNPTKTSYSLRDAGLSGALARTDAMNNATMSGENLKWARNQDALGQVSGMPGNATQMASSAQSGMNNMGNMQASSNYLSAQNASGYGRAGSALAYGLMKKDGGAVPKRFKARRFANGGLLDQLSSFGAGEVTTHALGNTPDNMDTSQKVASIAGDPIGVKLFKNGGRVNTLAAGGMPDNPVVGWRTRMASMPSLGSSVQSNSPSAVYSVLSGAAPVVAGEMAKSALKDQLSTVKDATARAVGNAKAAITPDSTQAAAPVQTGPTSAPTVPASAQSAPASAQSTAVSPAASSSDAAAASTDTATTDAATDAAADAATQAGAESAGEAAATEAATTAAAETAATEGAAATTAAANAWNPVGWGIAAAGLLAALSGRRADGGDMKGEPTVRTDMLKGGKVSGPGTETSDSVPAWLSDEEYVANADAVKLPKKEAEQVVNKWKKSGSNTKGLLEMINEQGLKKRYGSQARMVDGEAKPDGLAEGGSGLRLLGSGEGVGSYGSLYDALGVKGSGYFGPLKSKDGFSTEISAADESGDFPLIVPTLSADELDSLLRGEQPSDEVYAKARAYADSRRADGKSPYAENEGLKHPLPKKNGLSLGGMLGVALGAGADQWNVQRGQDRADEMLDLQKAGEQRQADEYANRVNIRKQKTAANDKFNKDLDGLDKNSPSYTADVKRLRRNLLEQHAAIDPDNTVSVASAVDAAERGDEQLSIFRKHGEDQLALGNRQIDANERWHKESLAEARAARLEARAERMEARRAAAIGKEAAMLDNAQSSLEKRIDGMITDPDKRAAAKRTLAAWGATPEGKNYLLTDPRLAGDKVLRLHQINERVDAENAPLFTIPGINVGVGGKPPVNTGLLKWSVDPSNGDYVAETGHRVSRSAVKAWPVDLQQEFESNPGIVSALRAEEARRAAPANQPAAGSNTLSGLLVPNAGLRVNMAPTPPSNAATKFTDKVGKSLMDWQEERRRNAQLYVGSR